MSSTSDAPAIYTAFLGHRQIARGTLEDVTRACARALRGKSAPPPLLVFDDDARPAELDLRGSPDEAAARAAAAQAARAPSPADGGPRGRGRPRLGTVAREVTLLPRHWEWLALQPGGASATLRRLVEDARRTQGPHGGARAAQERAYRFMTAIGGDLPAYEDALRALFAGQADAFEQALAHWPADIRHHARSLAAGAFNPPLDA